MNMEISLYWIVLLPFLGAILSAITTRFKRISDLIAFLFAFGSFMLLLSTDHTGKFYFEPTQVEITLCLNLNTLSWFFGVMVSLLTFLVVMFNAARPEKGRFTTPLVMTVGGSMAGILLSGDLILFFAFWELMTWSSYLLTRNPGQEGTKASYRYFLMSTAGAYSMLIGIAMIYSEFGSFVFRDIAGGMASRSSGFIYTSVLLFGIGFGVKAAAFPLHIWAPDAYSEADDGFTALFSGGLSKMGIYGFIVLIYTFVGIKVLLQVPGEIRGIPELGYVLAILGGITAMLGAILAIMQDDIKRLMAYSSVSQMGFILVGIGLASPLGMAGALFHAFNHAIFKALIFMGIAVVIRKTGTRKLSEMGGLIHRMPFTFLFVLIGIFAVAGIPITSGFTSKYLLYEAGLEKKIGILIPLLFIASVGSFLYSFRLLAGAFLGQLKTEHKDIGEASAFQLLPMGILALILIVFAIVPGLMLDVTDEINSELGIDKVPHDTFSVYTSLGSYNALTAFAVISGALVVGGVLWLLGGKARWVPPMDTYTSGEIPEEGLENYYHFAHGFYMPIERLFEPYLRYHIERFYEDIVFGIRKLSEIFRKIYTGNGQTYAFYTIAFLLFVLITAWTIL